MAAPGSVMENLGMRATVLIVDDHESFRASARRLLEADGYEVVGEAADGESGIAETGNLFPDLVLLDMQLPDIDGFEVARRLADAEHPPVVVLVSSRDRADIGSIDSRQIAGFIPKAELTLGSLTPFLS